MTSAAEETDVVVIGAGLAGLRCAVDLATAGLDVVLLERDEVAGGRVRTDEVDGFLVDRGFQLLNPAYSALTDLDVGSLGLQPFGAGVAARHEGGLERLGHPRAARLLPATIAYLARHPGEVRALVRWVRPLLRRPGSPLPAHLQDLVESGRLGPTLAQSWDAVGLDGRTRRIVERFLAGVLLDEDGASPADLALLLVAAFLQAPPASPSTACGPSRPSSRTGSQTSACRQPSRASAAMELTARSAPTRDAGSGGPWSSPPTR